MNICIFNLLNKYVKVMYYFVRYKARNKNLIYMYNIYFPRT